MYFLRQLNEKKNFVLLGESGCGKSEIALNLALLLVQEREVDFYDLDQTKPLYRSRDVRERLITSGIRFHCEEQFYDAPTATGGVAQSLTDSGRFTVLDVGGNDTGARLIGRYANLLNRPEAALFYVVNVYRPWSQSAEGIDATMSSILRAARLREILVLANPNLGAETMAAEFLEGLERTRALLDPYIAVRAACIRAELYEQVRSQTGLPLLPLRLYLKKEW